MSESNIKLESNVEGNLVYAGAGLIAAGTVGVEIANMLPEDFKAPVIGVSGALIAIGVSVMYIWKRFVNVWHSEVQKAQAQ